MIELEQLIVDFKNQMKNLKEYYNFEKNKNSSNLDKSSNKFNSNIDRIDKILSRIDNVFKYQKLFEEAPLAYFSIGSDKSIQRCNSAALKLLGYSQEEMLSMNVFDLYSDLPDGLPKAQAIFQHFLSGEKIQNQELQMKHKNGKMIWISLTAYPVMNQDGEIVESRSIVIDITKRRKAERRLRESEKRFRHLFENSPAAVVLVSMQGNILDCNYANERVFGYSKEELINKTFLDTLIFPIEQLPLFIERYNALLDGEIIEPLEVKLKRNDGGLIWVSIQESLIQLEEETLIQVIIQDIDERKRAERNLRESEKKYRHLFENSPAAVVLVSMQGNILDCNYANERVFGYSKEELINKTFLDTLIFPIEQLPLFIERYNALLDGEIIEPLEVKLKRNDGGLIWVSIQESLIQLEEETLIQVIIQDIDERKRAERSLKESEDKFKTIAEQSLVGICIIQDNLIKYVNQQILDIFGYSIEDIITSQAGDFLKVIHPEYRNFISDQASKKQLGLKDIKPYYQIQCFNKSREIIWIDIFSKTIAYKKRSADLCMIIDVTEIKKTEQKLEESEEKLSSVLENSPDIILMVDHSPKIQYINHIPQNFMQEPIIGKNFYDCLMPEHHNIYMKTFEKIFKTGIPETFDFPGFAGSWYTCRFIPITRSGIVDSVMLIITNITELKEAEKKIQESEEKYRNLFENAPDGISLLDSKGYIMDCNLTDQKHIGFDYTEIIGKHITTFFKEDYKFLFKKNFQILQKTGNVEAELELIRKDRKPIHIWRKVSAIYDENGEFSGAIVHSRNISKHKQVKQMIKLQLKFERTVSRISSQFVGNMDIDNAINASLSDMGRFCGANHSYIFKFNDISKNMSITHEWCDEGVTPQIDNLQNLPSDTFPWWMKKLNDGHVIHIKNVSLMPEGAIAEKKMLESQNVKTLLILPLTTSNVLSGFVGFDNIKELEKNNLDDFVLLRISSEIIGNALKRNKTEIELKESENNLKERVKELNCLYEISKLTEKPYNSPDEIIHRSLELIPPAMQFPSSICARIIFNNKKYITNKFKETEWKISTSTKINKKVIYIEIYYLEERDFLIEEANMLIDIANRLRNILGKNESERKLRESEIRYRKAYEHANFYKDLFTHDINNILNIIGSQIQLSSYYQDNPDNLKMRKKVIKEQIERGVKLVVNVRKLSQLEETQISLEPINVCSMIKNAIKFLIDSFHERKIEIEIDAPVKNFLVMANDLLLDVFENVLINAVKYNDESTVKIDIKISKMQKEVKNYLKIEIIDNGMGISDDQKKIIFHKGYMKEKQSKGMGLGLSLVKKIIGAYNGDIRVIDKVEGDYTKGSNFIILIPEAG